MYLSNIIVTEKNEKQFEICVNSRAEEECGAKKVAENERKDPEVSLRNDNIRFFANKA